MNFLILALGIATNTMASILMKLAVTDSSNIYTRDGIFKLLFNGPLILGIIFYIITLLMYVIALNRLPLNVAQPVLTAGAIASVSLVSFFIFHEEFYWSTIVGIIFVIIGVSLITLKFG